MYDYTFTVFTPTYNRAYSLSGAYESLKAQTFRDFEWLIINDGSTDGTEELIRQWQNAALFPIRYIFQENRGMHWAVNRGVREARGEFFLKLDSDDTCIPETLERLKYHWDSIPDGERDEFSGIACLTKNPDGTVVGKRFPPGIVDSNKLEMVFHYRMTGEKWGFKRTDIRRSFPYPEFEGEKFLPESTVWNKIALRYKTRYINEALRTYFTSPDRISQATYKAKSPKGQTYYYREVVNVDYPIPPDLLFRNYANYIRYSLHGRVSLATQVKAIRSPLYWFVALGVGYFLFLRDAWLLKAEQEEHRSDADEDSGKLKE